jgi:hypothetical protein
MLEKPARNKHSRLLGTYFSWHILPRRKTQYNDIQHKDTQHNYIQHKDILHNGKVLGTLTKGTHQLR